MMMMRCEKKNPARMFLVSAMALPMLFALEGAAQADDWVCIEEDGELVCGWDPQSQIDSYALPVGGGAVLPGATVNWSAHAKCTGPSSGMASCAAAGSSVGGNVVAGYTIAVRRVDNCTDLNFVGPSQGLTSSGTTNASGTASGSFTAPATSGTYSYLLRHGSENINGYIWSAEQVCTTLTVAATISCPANQTAECTSGTGGQSVSFTTPSDSSGALSVCSPASGSSFPVGTTADTCSTANASCSFSVTVTDSQGPSLTCPAPVNAVADASCQATVTPPAASATDACVGPLGPVSAASATFTGVGPKPVSYTANDGNGNATTATCASVNVVDQTPPTVTVPANQVVVGGCSPAGAAFTSQATAADNCGAVTPTCKEGSTVLNNGDVLGFGSHTVTCSATDGSGNSASASYTVTVLEPLSVSFLPPVSSTAVNKFKSTQTIPHKVSLRNCAGTDVTVSQAAGVTVKLGVTADGSSESLINDVSDFSGVGDAGGTMYLTDGHFQYNLKTNTTEYPSGGKLFTSSVTVAYSDHPGVTVGTKSATLQSK